MVRIVTAHKLILRGTVGDVPALHGPCVRATVEPATGRGGVEARWRGIGPVGAPAHGVVREVEVDRPGHVAAAGGVAAFLGRIASNIGVSL